MYRKKKKKTVSHPTEIDKRTQGVYSSYDIGEKKPKHAFLSFPWKPFRLTPISYPTFIHHLSLLCSLHLLVRPQTADTSDIAFQPLTRPSCRKSLHFHITLPHPHAVFRGASPPSAHTHACVPDRQFAFPPHAAPEIAARGLRGYDVDESVEEALQREHERFGVVQAVEDFRGVRERVDPIDGGGHPGDEEGAEEEEGDTGVEPGVGVGFCEGVIAG